MESPFSRKPYTLDRVVRLTLWLLGAVLVFFLVKKLSGVLLPFLVGWLIAYMLYPLVRFVQYKMKLRNRALSIVLVLLFVVAVLAGLAWLLVPMIGKEVAKMGVLVSNYLSNSTYQNLSLEGWVAYVCSYLEGVDFNDLLSWQNVENVVEKVMPQIWNVLSETWSFIVGLFVFMIVFLYMVFILIDYEKITSGFIDLIPHQYRALAKDILSDLEAGMNSYFRGQSLVAFIVGVLFSIGFSIIGLPLAIVCGLFLGLLNLVPYLQTIGIVPVVFLTLLKSAETGQSFWWLILGVLLVFVVVQVIQDFFLVPKIMGTAMGLKPAIILLSLSVWGALLGFVGLIVALPFTTLLISYYKRFVLRESKNSEPPQLS